MAAAIQVAGLATIKVATPASGTLDTLGYSENGVEFSEHVMTLDVRGDENGGDAGPPIDIQYMGEFHIVRMLMTKYDETIIDKIRSGIAGGTAGTPGTAGSLYLGGAVGWRLLIHSVNLPRNYLHAIFDQPKELNKGTKHSKALIVARCFKNASGLLYNATTV